MNINRRVLRILFMVSITTLLASSALFLEGMLVAQNEMKLMGKQLGTSTKNSVKEIVSYNEKKHLQQVVNERAMQMDIVFKNIARDVEKISMTAEEILSNSWRYSPQELRYSPSIEEGWSLTLSVAPSAVDNLENLRDKIALAANLQTILKSTLLTYDYPCSTYTAFEDGFDLVFDSDENDMRDHYFENKNPYRLFNFFERPWYQYDFPDLKKSSEQSLAKAAEKMSQGENGFMPVL